MKNNSVDMMRKIRDKLGTEIQEMTLEEEIDFIQNNIPSFQFLINEKTLYKNILNTNVIHSSTCGKRI